MIPKIYILILWGISNILLLEVTKGVDDVDREPFVQVGCNGCCAHDGHPRISVLRIVAMCAQAGYVDLTSSSNGDALNRLRLPSAVAVCGPTVDLSGRSRCAQVGLAVCRSAS